MFTIKLELTPEILHHMSVDEDTVIETYFNNGRICINFLDDADL